MRALILQKLLKAVSTRNIQCKTSYSNMIIFITSTSLTLSIPHDLKTVTFTGDSFSVPCKHLAYEASTEVLHEMEEATVRIIIASRVFSFTISLTVELNAKIGTTLKLTYC